MIHRNDNMLLRIAQGDAYGMAVEYIKFPRDQALQDEALRFKKYLKHPTHNLKAGQYTDDTQMSIAVAEVLLTKHETPQSDREIQRSFADSFVECFKRDQRDGYARHFQAFLESIENGEQFLERIKPDSDKNGAAMRSVPLGVLRNPKEVREMATLQAKLTHDTVGGVGASVAVALASHFVLYTDEPLRTLPAWLKRLGVLPEIVEPWTGEPVKAPGVGINTARAVVTLVSSEPSMLNIARSAIGWGGDVDSVLSIAWGIASTRMHENLPAFFEGGLENEAYGTLYLKRLGSQLMDDFA